MTDTLEKKETRDYYGDIALDWWKELSGFDQDKRDTKGHATLARLRRCHQPSDAFAIASVSNLLVRLNRPDWLDNESKLNAVGILAITLGHVKGHKHFYGGLMEPVGRESIDDKDGAKLSENRFRRFLQVREPDEMLAAFRRLVKFMPDEIDIKRLANTVLFWNDKTRRDLAFSYYGAYRAKQDATVN